MPYQPFPVEQFAGLNLVDDPAEVGASGAVDLLNVDVDKRGRVRSRDGFDNLTASAATQRLSGIGAFYKSDGTKQALVSADAGVNSFLRAYDTAGAAVGSDVALNAVKEPDFTRFGGPTGERIYVASWRVLVTTPNTVRRWDGSTWTVPAGMLSGLYALEVQASDNRLVGATTDSNASRIAFSDAGDPETWGVNNWVDLTPGDGERITGLVAWRELVFAFKETKFFVFTGTTIDGDGNPEFRPRPVSTGVGTVARQCAIATPNGVYFLSRRGIYRTTGGDPVLVSRAVDPIFRGGASSLYLGGVLNHAAINACQMAWHDERLYFAFPSGSATTNDRLLVFDPEADQWLLWDVAVNGLASFRVGDAPELAFTYATGSNHVGRLASTYTTDDGTAITSRYQSGFYGLGAPGSTAYTRWTRLWGSGAPTVSVLTDYGTTDANAGTVTLATAPATSEGYHQVSYAGKLFSHKLSASSTFSVSALEHDVAHVRP